MSILLRGGFLLIYNTNCMEEPLFRGNLQEREKKINFIVLQDWEDTVNKFRTCTVEGGSLFVVTLRRHMQSISITTKYYEIVQLILLTFFASVYRNYISNGLKVPILGISCSFTKSCNKQTKRTFSSNV